MTEADLPVIPRLCFSWLPRYRYALLVYQALQQACATRTTREEGRVRFAVKDATPAGARPSPHCVRPVLMDTILRVDDWCGYVRGQFEDQLAAFASGLPFFPLTRDVALIVAPEEGSFDLLNNVLPYMSPAPQTLTALLATAGGYAGVGEQELLEEHQRRRAVADLLREEIASRYGLAHTDGIRLHLAGVGGLIEGSTRYLHRSKPAFRTCAVVPEYWDLLRYVLTYSPRGLRVTLGRDRQAFPTDAWLAELARADVDFAYLSFTSNPLGTTIPEDVLLAALDAVAADTLFFIDCTSFDTEQRSSVERLAPVLQRFGHKNLLIAKSFSKEYDLGHLRIGYGLFTRPETAQAMWPFMAGYPPVEVTQTALQCLQTGNELIVARYREANRLLLRQAAAHLEVRVSGNSSNYTSVFFESEEAAARMKQRIAEVYGGAMYPGEVPMQGGGVLGLEDGEVDLTTMKRIPFLAPESLRLLVTASAVERFFALMPSAGA